jgi:hypothetical protein
MQAAPDGSVGCDFRATPISLPSFLQGDLYIVCRRISYGCMKHLWVSLNTAPRELDRCHTELAEAVSRNRLPWRVYRRTTAMRNVTNPQARFIMR